MHQVDLEKLPAVGKICGREQHGRLSLKGLITVPTKARQDLGIPLDATEFVFAYPLRTSMLAKVRGTSTCFGCGVSSGADQLCILDRQPSMRWSVWI